MDRYIFTSKEATQVDSIMFCLYPDKINVSYHCYSSKKLNERWVSVQVKAGAAVFMFDSMRKAIAWLETMDVDIAPYLEQAEQIDYELIS